MASASLPFSAPNPRSLPTSVNQPLEIVLANWQAQLANLISVTPPQVTPTNFAVSNQRGGMSLSWSPVPSGDGYEILKSANGSFVDDLQIVPIKNPAQCSYFDGTGGAATKVSYRIRTTSGTAANPQSQRGPESGPIQHTSIAVTDTTASPTVKYDTSTTTQTQSLARKGNYGAFRLTGLGKSGGANAGTGGATTAGGGTGGGVVPPPTPTTECPWSGLFGDMTISQVAPWDGPNVGTPDTGISRDGVGSLAIGNGSTGDASGNLDLATILASSSVTAGVNATSAGTFVIANGGALGVSITLQNLGATTAYNFNLPATPGTTGYVLTSQGGGSSSMTWATVVNSLTGDSLLYSNSTSTGAVTLALNTQTANYFLAGPTSGSAHTPTFRALVVGDLPTTGTWAFAGTLSGALTFTGNNTSTLGTATPGTNPSTAGFEIWQNTTPTVTGASTTLAIKTGTAPINVTGNTWRYTFAATESGAGSNAWVGASVTISGYTTTATGNNGTFVIIASTTTTFDVVNAAGTTADGGTPVVISSAVVNSPILQIAGTVNTGTAGTLNSVADVWSIQNVIGSVVANPTSTLTFTHSGSGGSAVVSVPFLVVGSGTGPCSISSANAGPFYGIDVNANGTIEIIQDGAVITEFNNGTTAIAVGAGACINWQNTTSPGNTANTDLLLSRVSPSVLGLGNVTTLGNFGGSLVSTGLKSDGGLLLQQFTTVVGTPTVTPATSGSTSYSYEVVALDINRQPIGVSAAGTTAAAASTITTTNFITVAWAAVAGAFAYAVYRSASGGTPSTTGLLSSSQTITAITTGTSTMVMTVASVAINTGIVGQLLTVSGSSHSNNNGSFYCTAATATSITVFNPYAVAEASPPASAAFIGGVVPAGTLSFQDIGFAANSVAAPSTNTSGSLGFVASYESASSGTALSQDFWSIYPVVASGLNGASTLTFTHSGSSGVASVSVPGINILGTLTDGVGSVGTNGQVLSSTVTGTKWINAAASGVTSITGDGTIISNSGSTGAVTLTLENAGQNSVLAGPISGGSGAPTFRALVAADVPTLNQNTTGTAANLSGTPALPNGTTATTQSPGNNTTNIATTAYADELVPAESTSGVGGFISTGDQIWGAWVNTATLAGLTGLTANRVIAVQFRLDRRVTINHVTIYQGAAAGTTATLNIGIYSSAGNLLLDTGGFNINSTADSVLTIPAASFNTPAEQALVLEPGVYYFAYSATVTATVTILSKASPGSVQENFVNKNAVHIGITGSGNVLSSGKLPSSLGTLGAGAGTTIPLAFFEP